MIYTTLRNLCVATLLLLVVPAHAEVFDVSATTPDGHWSQPLTLDVTYCITASGIATYTSGAYMDAEWQTQPYSNIWEEYDSTWDTTLWDDAHDVHDMFINNTCIQWLGSNDGLTWTTHTYSPSHIYKLYFTGTGASVKFHIADHVPIESSLTYGDNSGYLTVSIVPVPEPSSILTLLFCIGGLGGIVVKHKSK